MPGLDPLSRYEREPIQPGLISKGLECDTFKRRIVNLFPDTDEFEGITVARPVVDQHIIPEFFRHVGQRDILARVMLSHGDGSSLDIDAALLGFTYLKRDSPTSDRTH